MKFLNVWPVALGTQQRFHLMNWKIQVGKQHLRFCPGLSHVHLGGPPSQNRVWLRSKCVTGNEALRRKGSSLGHISSGTLFILLGALREFRLHAAYLLCGWSCVASQPVPSDLCHLLCSFCSTDARPCLHSKTWRPMLLLELHAEPHSVTSWDCSQLLVCISMLLFLPAGCRWKIAPFPFCALSGGWSAPLDIGEREDTGFIVHDITDKKPEHLWLVLFPDTVT